GWRWFASMLEPVGRRYFDFFAEKRRIRAHRRGGRRHDLVLPQHEVRAAFGQQDLLRLSDGFSVHLAHHWATGPVLHCPGKNSHSSPPLRKGLVRGRMGSTIVIEFPGRNRKAVRAVIPQWMAENGRCRTSSSSQVGLFYFVSPC